MRGRRLFHPAKLSKDTYIFFVSKTQSFERFRVAFTANDKREFAPSDHAFLFTCYKLFFSSSKNNYFRVIFIYKNCMGQLVSAHFLFREILNLNLPFQSALSDGSYFSISIATIRSNPLLNKCLGIHFFNTFFEKIKFVSSK